ncbi:MAG: spore germination protein GerW family protein [Bacteroidota bacterium]
MKKMVCIFLFLLPIFVFAQEISTTVQELVRIPIESLTADKAVGTPIQSDNKTIIPLFEANFGFGGGLGGPDAVYGGGAGGGMDLLPYSVIIISETGVQVIPVTNKVPFLKQLVDVLPQLIPIIMQYFEN